MTTTAKVRSYTRYLPDSIDETRATVLPKDRILFVELAHDQDPSNPLEDFDAAGKIQSLSRKHVNHIEPEAFEALIADDKDAVVLSYFEHGQCLWFVKDGPTPTGVEFQWDGTRVAGVWTPDDVLRNDEAKGLTGKKRRAKMLEWAAQACESYTAYCNGEVYGYDVRLYAVRKGTDGFVYDQRDDYRNDTALADDSCWGFIGDDYFRREVTDVVARIVKPKKGR